MPRAIPGILIQCDPSIKAILLKINKEHDQEFIIEDIDDETILIKDGKLEILQRLLKEVGHTPLVLDGRS